MQRESPQEGLRGRITGEMIAASAPQYIESNCYVVGTDSFVASMRETLTALGVPAAQVRTERFGLVLIVEIGATNVGSIAQTFKPGLPVANGAEKGYFRFGGSSGITLFEPGRVRLAEDLLRESARHREVYARIGEPMGTLTHRPR